MWDSFFDKLADSLAQGDLPQSLLITHREGVFEEGLRKQLVASLLCLAPSQGKACGHCVACQLYQAGTHPDYFHLVPEGASNTIKIDQVRAVLRAVAQRPHTSAAQVVVITQADRLNTAASNALLKALEEPTETTRWVLMSSRPMQLLPTIRSRTVVLRLPPLSASQVHQSLLQQGVPESTIPVLMAAFEGAPASALAAYESGFCESESLFQTAWADLQAKRISLLQFLDALKGVSVQQRFSCLTKAVERVFKQTPSITVANYFAELRQALAQWSVISGLNGELLFEQQMLNWCRLGL
ncbi:MAG: DNA polymerase III subunit delta' [Gammaproteobacteria bacterium CG11_big_fil_rev_8_21_14_0_20_46_22]|nr:MAG: DNA polymerase III subunit delta' [Gammaproteobacteria bacterium CG12_big_fil_rev_8_21_14_0_65_46_12]PIR10619.1 MAG: DNA polymerase III subunit delta' [Gammaproteobacteria bacterium CG11_big_fil_rev_8_21_14_0_20_46_22]